MPTISVIIPVYNAEKFLDKCVNSVLGQTFVNLEIILIDDGSSDASSKICDEYAHRDERIIVVHQKNAGVSAARNVGLAIATGEYITFVDSDDYIEPDMYSLMMEVVEEYNCDVVMCDCYKEYSDHREPYTHDIRAGHYSKENLQTEYYPHLLIMENLEYPPTISNWLCLFRYGQNKEFYLQYEEGIRYSEDLLFGALLIRQARSFYYMKGQNLYHYCMNPQSATHKYAPDKWEDYKRLYQRIKELFWNDTDFDFRKQVNFCLLFFIYDTIGDIYTVQDLSSRDKIKRIQDILETPEVRDMFQRINVFGLPVSLKQRIITWCYKYQFGIRALIKYYS